MPIVAKAWAVAAVGAALMLSPTLGQAATQPGLTAFKCPGPGKSVTMSDGSRLEFQGPDPSDAALCVWRTVRGGAASTARFVYAIHSIDNEAVQPGQMEALLRLLFQPSSEGNVTALAGGAGFNTAVRLHLQLAGPEPVTTRAGTFNAWIIRETGKGVFGNETNFQNTYWLDAKTGIPVRVREVSEGRSFELEAVHLP
jgi:hypothetical protein